MKLSVKIIQITVGILFIVSGLVKANDPMGLGYKMQEFFELWNTELAAGNFFLKGALISFFEFLHENAVSLSVLMITLEIVAGVAILIGYLKNFFLWLLLVLIIFFTFLTGYAYLSGKFTNCGCFGDCLPITPLTSFIKDIVLLVMIIFLIAGRKFIIPVFSSSTRKIIFWSTALLGFLMQWYVLRNLPFADCLPFKQGNNIPQQMLPPPGSVPDSFAMKFIYEKEGKQFEFSPEQLPADLENYKFIDRIDKLVRKGNAEPPIKNFSLTGLSGNDSTSVVLDQPTAILIFAQELNNPAWENDVLQLSSVASGKNIPLYLATPSASVASDLFSREKHSIQFFNADFTIVRTTARTEPTIYILEKGTIRHKLSRNEFDDAENIIRKNK